MGTPESYDVRQQRMAKLLGNAFLEHRVHTLEQGLEKMQNTRNTPSSARKLFDPQKDSPFHKNAPSVRNSSPKEPTELYVLHVSALVFALSTIRKFVKERRYRFLVPLDAIAALDVLKKAPRSLSHPAREAARYIEASLSPNPTSCLVPQLENDTTPWLDYIEAIHTTRKQKPSYSPDEPATGIKIPRHMRGTLQCALYQSSHSTMPCRLVVAEQDDVQVENSDEDENINQALDQLSSPGNNNNDNNKKNRPLASFSERVCGKLAADWAQEAGISVLYIN